MSDDEDDSDEDRYEDRSEDHRQNYKASDHDDDADRDERPSRSHVRDEDDKPAPKRHYSDDIVGTSQRAQSLVKDARDGNMSPEKLKRITEEGQQFLKEVQERGGRLDAADAAKLAGVHLDGNARKIAKHAETLARDGASLNTIAGMAAAGDIPMNDQMREIFKTFQQDTKGGEVDLDKIAQAPGLIVDKKTKKISLFGLGFEIEPQYAALAAAAYTGGISLVNKWVFGRAFKAGSALTTHLGAAQTIDPHTAGKLAGVGAVTLTTNWPSFNIFWQSEKDFRQKLDKFTQQLAPVLDQTQGRHSIGALFTVGPNQNEVIYNERRRMQFRHNAERYRNLVQATGPIFQTIASVMDGHEAIKGLEHLTPGGPKPGQAVDDYYKNLGQKAKEIEQHSQGMIKGDKAVEEARNLLSGKSGKPAAAPTPHNPMANTWSDWRNYGAFGITLLTQAVGNSIFGSRLNKIQDVSAFDMIMKLRLHLDEDPKQPSYPLPEGLKVEGAKGSAKDELPLAAYIKEIFQQHEKDCNGEEARIPSRLDEKLTAAAKLIAEELREGRLDGMALVQLVGERHIVRHQGKSVADDKTVRKELERLRAQMRHMEWTDGDKYIAESSFSKEELKQAWDKMASDERDVFVALVPPQALESAGVSAKEGRKRRQAREKQFEKDVAKVLEGALALGEEKLKEHNITDKEITMLQDTKVKIDEEGTQAAFAVTPEGGRKSSITQPLTELVVRHMHYGGRLQDLVQQQAVT